MGRAVYGALAGEVNGQSQGKSPGETKALVTAVTRAGSNATKSSAPSPRARHGQERRHARDLPHARAEGSPRGQAGPRVETLQRRTGRIIPYLFPHLADRHQGERTRDFRRVWTTACRGACIAGKHRHDFRRAAVRNMVVFGHVRQENRCGPSGNALISLVDDTGLEPVTSGM